MIINIVDGRCQKFRDHQLFKISNRHQLHSVRCLGGIEASALFELGKQNIAPPDRAGKELREKRNEQAVITEMPFRRIFPPVDID